MTGTEELKYATLEAVGGHKPSPETVPRVKYEDIDFKATEVITHDNHMTINLSLLFRN